MNDKIDVTDISHLTSAKYTIRFKPETCVTTQRLLVKEIIEIDLKDNDNKDLTILHGAKRIDTVAPLGKLMVTRVTERAVLVTDLPLHYMSGAPKATGDKEYPAQLQKNKVFIEIRSVDPKIEDPLLVKNFDGITYNDMAKLLRIKPALEHIALRVYSADGGEVCCRMVNGHRVIDFDTRFFESGNYLVELRSAEKRFIQKIVVGA